MSNFERSISVLSDIEDDVEKQVKKIAINIDRRLVLETPRKTGSAKSSWLVSVNSPITSRTIDVQNGTGAESIAKGARVASTFNFGDVIYIQNNQPYINRLDAGWSQQQPNPFIDSIIAEELNRGS